MLCLPSILTNAKPPSALHNDLTRHISANAYVTSSSTPDFRKQFKSSPTKIESRVNDTLPLQKAMEGTGIQHTAKIGAGAGASSRQ